MTEGESIHVYTDEGITYSQFMKVLQDLESSNFPNIEYHVHGNIRLYAKVKNGKYEMK